MQPTPPGPNFCDGDLHWVQGKPSLSTFVTRRSFTMFELLGVSHEDADNFLQDSVDRCSTNNIMWCSV